MGMEVGGERNTMVIQLETKYLNLIKFVYQIVMLSSLFIIGLF